MEWPCSRAILVVVACIALTSCDSTFPGDHRTETASAQNLVFSREFQDKARSLKITAASAWEQALKSGVSARTTTPSVVITGDPATAIRANTLSIGYAVAQGAPAGNYKAVFEIRDSTGGLIGTVTTGEFRVSASRRSATARNGVLSLFVGLVCAAIVKEADDGITFGIFAMGAVLGIGSGLVLLIRAIFSL